MSLLKKLRERKQDNNFQKSGLFVYVDNLDTLELREEKDYFMIGRYNDDRSQFINLATNQVFNLGTTYGNTMNLSVKDRNYSLVSNYGYYNVEDDSCQSITMKVKVYGLSNDNLLTTNINIDYKHLTSANFNKFKSFYKFLMKMPQEEVSLNEIKRIHKELNNYAYTEIVKQLEKTQSL